MSGTRLSTFYCITMCFGVEFFRSAGTKTETNSKDNNLLRSLLTCHKRSRICHSLVWCLIPRNTRERKMKTINLKPRKLSTEDPNWNKNNHKVHASWLFLGEGGKRDWRTKTKSQSGRFQWPLFWPFDFAGKITLKRQILLYIITFILETFTV